MIVLHCRVGMLGGSDRRGRVRWGFALTGRMLRILTSLGKLQTEIWHLQGSLGCVCVGGGGGGGRERKREREREREFFYCTVTDKVPNGGGRMREPGGGGGGQ